jgi:hypothetical protein
MTTNRTMCELQVQGDKFVCIYCGQPSRKLVRRNCPASSNQMPPILSSLWNLAKSLEVFIVDGCRTVTKEQYETRLTVCDRCDFRRENRCLKCGCWIALKARGRVFTCPEGLWPVDTYRADQTQTRKALVMKTNLIYHCHAQTNSNCWIMNLEQLRRRWNIFSHRRVFAIITGSGIHPKNTVVEEIRSIAPRQDRSRIEFLFVENDERLREVKSFPLLLKAVESVDPQEITFYAHSKGTSTNGNNLGVELWRNQMYHALLDNIHIVHDLLTRVPAVGTHKMRWPVGADSPYPTKLKYGNWMFAGTFFWFKNDRIFTRNDWVNIPDDRYGAEAWLSGMFSADDVVTLFQPWPVEQFPAPNPYDPSLYRWPIRD